MKKFLLLSALIAFSSCQQEDKGYTALDIRYKTEFVKEFGHPDPEHTWGFVEQDAAYVSPMTRVGQPNANQWGDMGLDVPEPLTSLQIETVTVWFETHQNPTGLAVSWTDYFAQQVSSKPIAKQHMDYLLDAGHNSADHIYNYNSGDCSMNYTIQNEPHGSFHADKIQYMTGQSTKHFGFHESLSDKTYFDHYVIISGEMIDPDDELGAKGQSIYGMFFVGFDYEANGIAINQKIARDYYFDDWIIKISPGTHSSIARRVMCEDLGNSFDWDFNDVVFDVSFTDDWSSGRHVTYANISVQCAGGTMSITVGTTDNNMEVHSLFGVEVGTPVIHPAAPVVYSVVVDDKWWLSSLLQQWFGGSRVYDASIIPVYVGGEDVTALAQNIQRSRVPQRFSCPTSVMWSEELTNICETYPQFPSWVGNDSELKDLWYCNPKK